MPTQKMYMWKSVALLVIGLGAIIFVALNILEERARTHVIDQNIKIQEERRSQITQENDSLRHVISYLKSDEAGELSAMQKGYQEKDQDMMVVKNIIEAEDDLMQIDEKRAKAREMENQQVIQPQWKVWFDIFF